MEGNGLAAEYFNFHAKHSLQEGIRKTVTWFFANRASLREVVLRFTRNGHPSKTTYEDLESGLLILCVPSARYAL